MLEETSGLGGGFGLPGFVEQTFAAYLRCGILAHGFARVRCKDCGDERLIAFSCKRRGLCPSCEGRRMCDTAANLVERVLPVATYRQWTLSLPRPVRFALVKDPALVSPVLQIFLRSVFAHQRRVARKQGLADPKTGAITFVQRFGSTVNLNLHFHSLIPDGVFIDREGTVQFVRLPTPTDEDIVAIARRVGRRVLARMERELEDLEDEPGAMDGLYSQAIQTTMPWAGPRAPHRMRRKRSALVEGFSLHAGGAIHEHDRASLERVLRYGARPPLCQERLAYDGHEVRYRLRKPTNHGQTELRFMPTEFLRRLASLIPPPRQNLTRYHGVFAPRSRLRALAPGSSHAAHPLPTSPDPSSGRYRRSWAELLQRVFEIDVTRCAECGGRVKVIAQIKERAVIVRILEHLGLPSSPPQRAPPRLLDLAAHSYSSAEAEW